MKTLKDFIMNNQTVTTLVPGDVLLPYMEVCSLSEKSNIFFDFNHDYNVAVIKHNDALILYYAWVFVGLIGHRRAVFLSIARSDNVDQYGRIVCYELGRQRDLECIKFEPW